YRITSALSVMASIEHISNAWLCSANDGLTNVGMRIGYRF
ncbi:MAG TPA: acyloxyacyl hydrolase, partial [Rhodobiaceae bacterium]|nr:acyloxyacyl hydrolase [Rhodobiaceae bacterium]